jgi:hypothetical protein
MANTKSIEGPLFHRSSVADIARANRTAARAVDKHWIRPVTKTSLAVRNPSRAAAIADALASEAIAPVFSESTTARHACSRLEQKVAPKVEASCESGSSHKSEQKWQTRSGSSDAVIRACPVARTSKRCRHADARHS